MNIFDTDTNTTNPHNNTTNPHNNTTNPHNNTTNPQNNNEKRIKGVLFLPKKYWQILDNSIDGELVRTKSDAFMSLMKHLHKLSPDLVKFDKMVYIKDEEFTELKNRLLNIITTQSKYEVIVERVSKWYGEDVLALEGQSFDLALDGIEAKLKGWARVGNDGLNYLRMNGYFKKNEADQQSAPVQVQP